MAYVPSPCMTKARSASADEYARASRIKHNERTSTCCAATAYFNSPAWARRVTKYFASPSTSASAPACGSISWSTKAATVWARLRCWGSKKGSCEIRESIDGAPCLVLGSLYLVCQWSVVSGQWSLRSVSMLELLLTTDHWQR